MKGTDFLKSMDHIDDDLLVSADTPVVKKNNSIKRILPAAAAACLVTVCAVFMLPALQKNKAPAVPVNTAASDGGTEADEAGGINGKINLKAKLEILGADYAVSSEEGYAYLSGTETALRNELAASGVGTDRLTVTKTGYSHIRTGKDGNSIDVSWRDYLLYSGDTIVAAVTVHKDEAGLHHYIAFGSPAFGSYAAFLADHRGEELVMLWIGDVDAVITPGGEIYSFGTDVSAAVDTGEAAGYYSFFKTKYNTYIPG